MRADLDHLVDVLDRQFSFLLKQQGPAFVRQLGRCLAAVEADPRLAAICGDLRLEVQSLVHGSNAHDVRYTDQLVALRDRLTAGFPDSRDTTQEQNRLIYPHTLAAFDSAVAGTDDTDRRIAPHDNADPTVAGRLFEIFGNRLDRTRGYSIGAEDQLEKRTAPLEDPEFEDIEIVFRNLREEHDHWRRRFLIEKRTSPGVALISLSNLFEEANPLPEKHEKGPEARAARWARRMEAAFNGRGRFQNALYCRDEMSKEDLEVVDAVVEDYRPLAERLYEELRIRIGTRRSLLTLLERFKHRCEWHDAERLRGLVKNSRKRVEAVLTSELARWLFDQGLSPIAKPMTGGLQPDLIDPSAVGNLYVEAKQYGKSARSYLLKGVGQLRDTVAKLNSTDYAVSEAFYVVFRCGGRKCPVHAFPPSLSGPGYTVHFRVIDITDPKEAGSRQDARVAEITEEDLKAVLGNGRRGPDEQRPRASPPMP